jgi:leader peptidase (prepilin peptidase) / N-methyltransferase
VTGGPTTTAIAAALLGGPLTLTLARRGMDTSWTPGRTETAAICAMTGVVAALAVHGPRPAAVLWPLVLLGPAAAVVDACEGRLPDVFTGPLLAATLLIAAASGSDGATEGIGAAGAACAVAGLIMATGTNALGWGDAKLIPTLAIVLNQQGALLVGLLHTTILIGATAAVLFGMRHHRDVVPYGPALLVGGVAAGVGL